MKRFVLIGLLFAAFVGVAKAQLEQEEIEIDEESSGEAPHAGNRGLVTDDEDFAEESEGSGSPVVTPDNSNSGGEVTFEEQTEPTTQAQDKKRGNSEGKSRNIAEQGVNDSGSEGKAKEQPELEDPITETDSSEGTADEVKGPDGDGVAVASAPSIQFLAAVIVGGCIGLLFAICVIMLLVYRMRKKDEGSYALDYGLDKKPQGNYEYTKGVDSKEYFA